MDVDHPEARDAQQRVGQQPSVRRDHAEVGSKIGNRRQERVVTQPCRLEDRDPGQNRNFFGWRRGHALAASFGPVGLRDQADDGVARSDERRQGRDRERRRAEVHDPQRRRLYHRPERFSF